jgi:cytoskeletal protein RodZ
MLDSSSRKAAKLFVVGASLATFVAGCQTTDQGAATAPAAAQVQPAAATATTQTPLPNGNLQASLSGQTANLRVVGGQPVAYTWGTYSAQNVRRLANGDVQVDAATLRNVTVSGNQVQGIWDFRGQQIPVVFR